RQVPEAVFSCECLFDMRDATADEFRYFLGMRSGRAIHRPLGLRLRSRRAAHKRHACAICDILERLHANLSLRMAASYFSCRALPHISSSGLQKSNDDQKILDAEILDLTLVAA